MKRNEMRTRDKGRGGMTGAISVSTNSEDTTSTRGREAGYASNVSRQMMLQSGIHTPSPRVFWPSRHNFGDIEMEFHICCQLP